MTEDIYDVDTSSRARGDGIRDLVLTDRWNTPLGTPNGGYILAVMLRGLGDEMEVADPLVASITYLSSPRTGDAELRTSPLRRGRRVQTGAASLWEGERHVAEMTASFGARRQDAVDLELGTPPELRPPDQCVDPRDHGMSGGIFDRVDYRIDRVPGFVVGKPSGDPTVTAWQRLRDGRAYEWPAVALLCDSYAPPVAELGQSSMTVQLTVHLHRLPRAGWLATRISTRHLVNGFHEEDCELWDEDGQLVAQSRQLGILL